MLQDADGLDATRNVTVGRNGSHPEVGHTFPENLQHAASLQQGLKGQPLCLQVRISGQAAKRVLEHKERNEKRGLTTPQSVHELIMAATVEDPVRTALDALEDVAADTGDLDLQLMVSNFISAQGKSRRNGTLRQLNQVLIDFCRNGGRVK